MKKRIFFILTAAAAALLLMPASYASGGINGFSDDFGTGGYYYNRETRKTSRDIASLERMGKVEPGTEIFIILRSKDFKWDNGDERELNTYRINEENLDPQFRMLEGEDVIESVSISWRDDQPGLLIRFMPSLRSVDTEEFRADIFLGGGGFTIGGEFANRSVSVGRHTKSVTLGPGRLAVALYEDGRDITFDLGEGVSVKSDLEFTGKAYGIVDTVLNSWDRRVIAQHPHVQHVVRIDSVNLSGPVTFDKSRYGNLFVYDGSLNLLGTTENSHKFVTTYYLSTEKLT